MLKNIYKKVFEIPGGMASDKTVKGCLVLEGGAFRGVYTSAVLDQMMLQDINLECVIGVSAGALNGINYVAGNIGRSGRINLVFRHDQRYIGPRALVKGHSVLNLNFLLEEAEEMEPLNMDRLMSGKQRFLAVATNCNTGTAEYFELGKCGDIFQAVKASASMPLIAPMVEVDGIPCLDGGCVIKTPYQWALDQGFEKVVVVRTRPRDFRKVPSREEEKLASIAYRHHKELARAVATADDNYNRECDMLDLLEREGRVFVIAPSEKVEIGRVEKDMEKLGHLYELGVKDASDRMEALKKYLEIH